MGTALQRARNTFRAARQPLHDPGEFWFTGYLEENYPGSGRRSSGCSTPRPTRWCRPPTTPGSSARAPGSRPTCTGTAAGRARCVSGSRSRRASWRRSRTSPS
ncbi:hypothetical protein NKH77_07360 [Streptomyces sp. M19]